MDHFRLLGAVEALAAIFKVRFHCLAKICLLGLDMTISSVFSL